MSLTELDPHTETDRTLITILTLNINGLCPKLTDLEDLALQKNPHLICITETKLDAEVSDDELDLQGYTIARKDRDHHGGGVAIYHQRTVSVTRLSSEYLLDTNSCVELVAMMVRSTIKRPGTEFILACIYRPPSQAVSWWRSLEDILDSIARTHPKTPIFLTGDFNVDMLDQTHPHTKHIHHLMGSFNLVNHVTSPTRYSATRNSCLDLFLGPSDLFSTLMPVSCVTPTLIPSDHELVCTTLHLPRHQSAHQDRVHRPLKLRRHFNSTIVSEMKTALLLENLNTFSCAPETDNIDIMWTEWMSKVTSVLDKYAPLTPVRPRVRTPRYCPWTTPALRHLMHHKLRLHTQLGKNPGDANLRAELTTVENHQFYHEAQEKHVHTSCWSQ